ncbi:MAG: M23 family metallopeptidase [Acidimicrobiia bacterium]|nr:M23 family metallopeptidase [Acidimicrobiia bacterium]
MRRATVAAIAFTLVLMPAFTVSAQSEITRDDIATAEAERRAISANLETVTADYDAAVARLIELENSLTSLGIELAEKEQELAAARVAAREVASDRYKYAGSSSSVLFHSATIQDVPIRAGYLDILSREGTDIVIRLFGLEESYQAQQVLVEQALASQVETKNELEELATSILGQLEAANRDYDAIVRAFEIQEEERRKREEEERRRAEEERIRREEEERRAREATSTTAAPSTTTTVVESTTLPPDESTTTSVPNESTTTTTSEPPTSTTQPPPAAAMVCPVDGAVAFTDTWGDPRSGGRTHKGVDMIAARGTPLVAIEAGTVKRMRNGGLGGITVTLRGISGDEFYYAHLDGWAAGLSVGQSLAVGELLGYVGNTGNAQYTIPHLHFEWAPGGGAAVNPYPLVADLCL